MVPKMVPKLIPKLVPSIVKKEHIFCSEIPFSILKDKIVPKIVPKLGSWYMSENQSWIWGPFWGPFFSSESGSCALDAGLSDLERAQTFDVKEAPQNHFDQFCCFVCDKQKGS